MENRKAEREMEEKKREALRQEEEIARRVRELHDAAKK